MSKLKRPHYSHAQLYEYWIKRRALEKRLHEIHYEEEKEIFTQLEEIYSYKHNHHPYSGDFEHYYRRFRIAKPMPLILVLALWTLLFINTNLETSVGIVLCVFTVIITVSSIFQMFFMRHLEKRILRPIDQLRRAVDEITNGNYEVEINTCSHSEVDMLIDHFNDMARKLNEVEQLKKEYEDNRKDLIANISHDLKTPITSIQGYIEAILTETEKIPAEKQAKYLTIIHNNIVYINRLIDDLFLFSKLDMQKLSLEFTTLPIRPFMQDLMEEFKLEFEEQKILFEYKDSLLSSYSVTIDPKRFHQVIRNILDNAIKYGQRSDLSIFTRLYNNDKSICLDLSDNGPGIPEEELKNVFKRFYRLDNQRTKDFGSTGLGLAIARELIEQQGGQITAGSSPGGGTCFTITLPAVTGEEL